MSEQNTVALVRNVPARIRAFYEHGLPGMTLAANNRDPLVKRCPCGKQISQNKHWCYEHLVAAIERVASGQETNAQFVRLVAQHSTSAQRIALIRRLQAKSKGAQMSKRNNLAVVSARKGKGKRGKVKHMVIKPTDNGGFSSEVHYHPESAEDKQMPYNMEPETGAHTDQASMMDHVGSVFPPDSAKPAPEGEPDGDEE